MKRGRNILLILAACGVVAAAALVGPKAPDPECNGKKLSAWLRAYDARTGVAAQAAASTAVRQLGTNALPLLLRWIAYEPPAWRDPAPVRDVLLRLPMNRWLWKGDIRADQALWGFQLLGPAASPAVPELTRLMNEPAGYMSTRRAMAALAAIGKEGLPPLLAWVEGLQAWGRFGESRPASDLILRLQVSGVDISAAVPALLFQKYWEDSTDRSGAASDPLLPALPGERARLTTNLVNYMRHTNSTVRWVATRTVGAVVEKNSAVPALKEALNDRDNLVHAEAARALQRIEGK